MFARTLDHAHTPGARSDFDMYMTPAEEVEIIEVHAELIAMAAGRGAGKIRFAVACAYAVPDAGPFGEIEVAIDDEGGRACGLHRLRNPDRVVKAPWFSCATDFDAAVGGVYDRIKSHYGIGERA